MHSLIAPEYVWLAEALFTALVLGLAFAIVVGMLLLISPSAALAASERLNRWIDTTAHFQKLERTFVTERFVYRHHRIAGGLLSVSALFVLWCWLFAVPKASIGIFFPAGRTNPLWDWVAPASDLVIVALHVFAAIVGVVIFVRPSLLKGFEKAANQWHHVRGHAVLDTVVATLDEGFFLYPRLGGLVLVASAGGCLVALWPVLLEILRR